MVLEYVKIFNHYCQFFTTLHAFVNFIVQRYYFVKVYNQTYLKKIVIYNFLTEY